MDIPLATVCRIIGAPRSAIYHRRGRGEQLGVRPGPKTSVPDDELTELIRHVIVDCLFAGEGHRKVRARLRRDHGLSVGKNRVLRLMRDAGLLAPQRARRRRQPRLHDGTVITTAPNARWGTDATMAWTKTDGWVWVFVLVDHYSDEAWAHVAKIGNSHPEVHSFSQVQRAHAESFKAELAQRRIFDDKGLKPNTVRLRLLCLRSFFDRINEWGWPEAPDRPPLFLTDVPAKDEPLPKALDDAAAARFMRAAAAEGDPRRQLVVELLARTGMRVGELCALRVDAMEQRGGQWWLRIPLGKLHTDRYVPLHPRLVELLTAWRKHHDDAGTGLLITNDGRALNRHVVTRMVRRVARAAGIGHVHPHQLRHTLATQAINRGMRLEAISQLLGHRTLEMTAVYARIADRTVADEYQMVSERVEAFYASEPSAETVQMRRLRREHSRLLGNGWCTRPKEMDCSFESVCEGWVLRHHCGVQAHADPPAQPCSSTRLTRASGRLRAAPRRPRGRGVVM